MRYTFFARIFFAVLLSLGFALLIPQAEAQTLGAPTSLTASNRGSTGFDVGWTAPTTNLTITGYDVRYKVVSTATFSNAGHTGTTASFTFTGLTANTSYEVQVRALAGTETGTWSATLYTSTLALNPIGAPTSLTASNATSTGFQVSWTAPTSNLTITGYDVRYRVASATTFSDAGHSGTTTSFTFTGLTANTAYVIQVRTVAGTDTSVWSAALNTSTLALNPIGAPTSLTASNIGSTGLKVSWTAPTTNLTITGYDVRYRVASATTFSDAGHTGTTTSFTFTGLTANTAYVIQVRTVAGTDTSVWSAALNTSTLPLNPVDAPTSLTASNTTSTGFQVSWTAPTSNLTITGYDVRYKVAATTTFSDAGHTGTTTSFTFTGLTASTAYEIQVRTLAGTETSVWSASLYSSTLASTADALPSLSSAEVSQLGNLLKHDTVIFNELRNTEPDTNDWLELRNVSEADISLDDWQLTIRRGSSQVVVEFPAGTVIPAGGVLLLTNTEIVTGITPVSSVIVETFALPATDFALILRSPTVFGDIAGNYLEGEAERPETLPAFTMGRVWYRTQPIMSGYRAEAWAQSTSENGIGTPGYRHPAAAADLNNDGLVNILDLVLVASQFGTTNTTADLNADGTVNIDDLVFVANAWGSVAGAPTAGTVNTWLQLARQNVSEVVTTSASEEFSYARGLQTLEQLAQALVPDTTALLANYPNPFNPETWIPYQLAKAADVTISIHAADGNVVRTLILGHQDAGMYKNRSHAAYWDGKNTLGESVASGLYFYTLTAGDFTATRKMLILK